MAKPGLCLLSGVGGLLCLVHGDPVFAQARIEEIVVTATPHEQRALQPAIELGREQIAERAPVALTDLFEGLPAIGIRTNSRGEAVLRLRGSEERQTSIFLDGAPLSVPWDGRVDLQSLPAGIVDRVRITSSAAPIEYGGNSVLGVVDIQTPVGPMNGLHSVQAEAASEGAGSLSAMGGTRVGKAQFLLGGTYRTLDGQAVSDTGVIPYAPTGDGMRDNTDLASTSLFAGAGIEETWGALRLSLLSIDAEKGIAPAGHIDPAIGSPRYWRYPRWRFNQLTFNSGIDLGAEMNLRTTVWYQDFEQTIDQYLDDTYQIVGSSEDDSDRTLGTRLVLDRSFDGFDIRLVGNAQTTTHEQVDTDRVNGTESPLRSYQQDIFSLGAEIDTAPRDDLVLSAAISRDRAATPETGGREAQDELSDWAASMAARWSPNDQWQIAGTLGQRTRFPSLREMYGEALGKFLLNPGLKPESTLLADLTLERTSADERIRARLTPWYLTIENTLSRRSIVIEGVRRRQRYNLDGSYGYGLEGALSWEAHDRLKMRLTGNWQHLRARLEEDGTRPVLYQRPKFQTSFLCDWIVAPGWDLFLAVRHLGSVLDENEEGQVVELPSSTEIDLRVFRTLAATDGGRWRVYAAVENATDEIILPQLGLPQPGRTVSVGLTFERI